MKYNLEMKMLRHKVQKMLPLYKIITTKKARRKNLKKRCNPLQKRTAIYSL